LKEAGGFESKLSIGIRYSPISIIDSFPRRRRMATTVLDVTFVKYTFQPGNKIIFYEKDKGALNPVS